jgi:hypothetical protein
MLFANLGSRHSFSLLAAKERKEHKSNVILFYLPLVFEGRPRCDLAVILCRARLAYSNYLLIFFFLLEREEA